MLLVNSASTYVRAGTEQINCSHAVTYLQYIYIGTHFTYCEKSDLKARLPSRRIAPKASIIANLPAPIQTRSRAERTDRAQGSSFCLPLHRQNCVGLWCLLAAMPALVMLSEAIHSQVYRFPAHNPYDSNEIRTKVIVSQTFLRPFFIFLSFSMSMSATDWPPLSTH